MLVHYDGTQRLRSGYSVNRECQWHGAAPELAGTAILNCYKRPTGRPAVSIIFAPILSDCRRPSPHCQAIFSSAQEPNILAQEHSKDPSDIHGLELSVMSRPGRICADIGCVRVVMMQRVPRAFFVLIWCLLARLGSHLCAQQYPFLPVAGSPKGAANMFQDSTGRLWLGGEQLSCFDGARFFLLRDYGYPTTETYDITEDPSGAIWIGAAAGVYRFANGHISEIGKQGAYSVVAITPYYAAAVVAPAGQTTATLVRMRYSGRAWKTDTVLPLGEVVNLRRDLSGNILFPLPGRGWAEMRPEMLARWRPGEPAPVEIHPGGPGVRGASTIARDRSGCLWIGTSVADGYDCGDGIHLAPYKWALVSAGLSEASDGRMVLSGSSLLAVGRPRAFQVATTANGLPPVATAYLAKDGTLWLSNGGGLARFAAPFRIEYWTPREGISDDPWAITRIAATINAGLSRRIVALSKDRLRWETKVAFEEAGAVVSLLVSCPGNK